MTEVFTPDTLFAGSFPEPLSGSATLKAGQGVLTRGTVLGKILLAIAAAVKGTNTGAGTCTDQALGKGAKLGTYAITCITAATNGGTFKVIDPESYRLADAIVGTAYAGPVCFKLNDGATDFAVGDSFTLTVSAGSGQFAMVNSANVDGSQYPDAVLAQTIDATSAHVAPTYETGIFNEGALTFGGTDTADTHRAALRAKGIFLRTVL